MLPEALDDAAERHEHHGRDGGRRQLGGRVRAVVAVADTVKDDAATAVARLHAMGIETAIITGDNHRTAAAIAAQVGIDRVLAEVLPDGKQDEIARLQADGRSVAMVGDGINDAPTLVQADLGIAIGTGTDVAIESSDLTLMRSDLDGVATAIELSRATERTIRQNFGWAFGYSILAIPHRGAGVPVADRGWRRDGLLERQRGHQLTATAALRTTTGGSPASARGLCRRGGVTRPVRELSCGR